MKNGLFLDDERVPSQVKWVELPKDVNWTIVRNFDEFVDAVQHNSFDVISFDHDLGDAKTKTGQDCVKWLVNYMFDLKLELIPKCYFHTKNPVGLGNMSVYWKNAVKEFLSY